ncbi:class I SAM-dependent methyltransferase, partial [Halomonas lysinitropha]
IGDVGCGTGVLVSKFKDAFPNSTIKGYDFSGNKIQQCNKYYNIGENVFYIHNIYSELPQRFDILVATEVLEHLEYPEVALDNLLSGLNYKGRLFITVPNGREDTFSGHIHFWSPESWRLFIKKNIKNPFDVEVGNVFNNNYALITRVDVE